MALPISNVQDSSKLWRVLQSPYLWIIAALCFSVLAIFNREASTWTSPLWFIDPFLMFSLLTGLWLKRRFHIQSIHFSPRQAALVFIALVWLMGMLYELTLSESPGNIGGFHAKTIPSFILVQGFYLPYAILIYIFICRFHLGFRDVFLVGGLVSLYEALQFGVPGTLFSPLFILTPLVLAYYVVVYAMILTLPLLVVDERLLWHGNKPKLPWWRKVLYSLILGMSCWFITGLWGELITMFNFLHF